MLAARPATLWAAMAPVFVAGGLASGDDVFRWDAFVGALVGAVAIQIGANFANDASDAHRGADTVARIGPQRMVASGVFSQRQMWRAVGLAFAVAAIAGVWLITIAGWVIAVVGVVSIIAGLGYVGGPRPYGYRGLGELFVFIFFGLVATVVSRYTHDMTIPLDTWLLALPMGFLVTAILVANNVRDIDTDAETGKRTLAVMIGRERTRHLYATLVFGAFVLIAVFGSLGLTQTATLFSVFWIPWAIPLVKTVYTETDGAPLIGALAGTARLQLLVGLTLAVGSATV